MARRVLTVNNSTDDLVNLSIAGGLGGGEALGDGGHKG